MNENDFLKKIKTLEAYSQEHKTITLFELDQLFGSLLFNVVIFTTALPLLFFSTQWIVFPLTTFIVMCTIWCFFDNKLWMPDKIKAIKLPSNKVQKTALFIEKICQRETWPDLPVQFWSKLRLINILIIGLAAFQIGYLANPGQILFFKTFTILVLAYASLVEKGWLSCVGYLFFLISSL